MFRIGHSSDKKGTNAVMGYVAPRFLYHTMVSKVFMVSPQNIQIKVGQKFTTSATLVFNEHQIQILHRMFSK